MSTKKTEQLGLPHGTAQARLRKNILFDLLVRLELNKCFQCGLVITDRDDLSIEHKVPWLDSEDPVKLFFDLDNIAFSHLSCNISAARQVNRRYFTEDEARRAKNIRNQGYRAKYYTPEKRREKYLRTGT